MKMRSLRKKIQGKSKDIKRILSIWHCSLLVSVLSTSFFFTCCVAVDKPALEKESIVQTQEFDLIPMSDEKVYAQEIVSEIEKDTEILSDETLNGYLKYIGLRIVSRTHFRHLIKDWEWSFKIINSYDVNAFAALGGRVFVCRGIIEKTESEAELAGILAFEIGHVMGRHVNQHIYKKLAGRAGFSPGQTLTGERGWEILNQIFETQGGALAFFSNLKYDSSQVEKSDEFVLSNSFDAGFNPEGFKTLVDRLGKKESPPHPWIEKNPWSKRRMEKISSSLELLPSFPFKEEHSEFIGFKDHLRSLLLPSLKEKKKISVDLTQESTFDISVLGHLDWTDTGVDVREGQEVYFKASGIISLQKGNPMVDKCEPDGYNLKTLQQPLSDHKIGALIGQVVLIISIEIDEETGEEIRNEVIKKFYIGSENRVQMPLTGRLFLGINENVVGDNEGEYKVRVSLDKNNSKN